MVLVPLGKKTRKQPINIWGGDRRISGTLTQPTQMDLEGLKRRWSYFQYDLLNKKRQKKTRDLTQDQRIKLKYLKLKKKLEENRFKPKLSVILSSGNEGSISTCSSSTLRSSRGASSADHDYNTESEYSNETSSEGLEGYEEGDDDIFYPSSQPLDRGEDVVTSIRGGRCSSSGCGGNRRDWKNIIRRASEYGKMALLGTGFEEADRGWERDYEGGIITQQPLRDPHKWGRLERGRTTGCASHPSNNRHYDYHHNRHHSNHHNNHYSNHHNNHHSNHHNNRYNGNGSKGVAEKSDRRGGRGDKRDYGSRGNRGYHNSREGEELMRGRKGSDKKMKERKSVKENRSNNRNNNENKSNKRSNKENRSNNRSNKENRSNNRSNKENRSNNRSNKENRSNNRSNKENRSNNRSNKENRSNNRSNKENRSNNRSNKEEQRKKLMQMSDRSLKRIYQELRKNQKLHSSGGRGDRREEERMNKDGWIGDGRMEKRMSKNNSIW